MLQIKGIKIHDFQYKADKLKMSAALQKNSEKEKELDDVVNVDQVEVSFNRRPFQVPVVTDAYDFFVASILKEMSDTVSEEKVG